MTGFRPRSARASPRLWGLAMADTRHWTLQDFADAAGTRTTPYPGEGDDAALAPDHRCQACGADLTGRKTPAGLPLVYCGKACRRIGQRVWRSRIEDEAAVALRNYLW